MAVLFFVGVTVAYWAEAGGNPILRGPSRRPSAGNMEGKEVRFGVANSALFATVTTDASLRRRQRDARQLHPARRAGAARQHPARRGRSSAASGAGLYGILVMVVLSVFIAGLMVGRTPEYLGKKIEAREMKLAMLYVLIFPLRHPRLHRAGRSVAPYGLSSLNNAGPHGLSEILYAFTSGAGNNGSAFAGLSANTPFYNTTLGLAMLIGRFLMIVPALAIAGSLVGKKVVAAGPGHVPHQRPALRRPAPRA